MDVSHLAWIEREPGGREWLDALGDLVRAAAADWSLRLGLPFKDAHVSFTAPARRVDGTRVVLKLQYPHRECDHEAAALAAWDGVGAVRLIETDPDRHALLLERCDPGRPLTAEPEPAALDVLIGLLPRLWREVGAPFSTLADEAAYWVDELSDPARIEMLDRKLVDHAVAVLRELGPSQTELVLLHQDLHGGNVLSAAREPWLAIDPKPLIGERAFSIAPIVRDFDLTFSRSAVRSRFDRLCEELTLDRERALGWTIGQTVAWSAGGRHAQRCRQTVRWLLGD